MINVLTHGRSGLFKLVVVIAFGSLIVGQTGCSSLGIGEEEGGSSSGTDLLSVLPSLNNAKDKKLNENVSARTIYGEKGVVLYDPLGDGSDFVLDSSGRIVKSDVDAAEAQQEINDLERRFYLSNKHLKDGENLFYSGLYEESLIEVNAALELTPRSAKAYGMKGSAEYKLGNVEKAKAAWMVALKLDPNMKSAARALFLVN